jgi:hypothetical protein
MKTIVKYMQTLLAVHLRILSSSEDALVPSPAFGSTPPWKYSGGIALL